MTPRPLKVLHVITDSFSAFEFVAPLIMTASEHGVSSVLACSERSYPDAHSFMADLEGLGLDVRNVPLTRSMVSVGDDARALWALVQLIREVGPDGWLRVSVGTPQDMTAFQDALSEVAGL
jgi:histidinol-phosphate/aromatic aminotransferase/cobyric acid decarboxylase-like protein